MAFVAPYPLGAAKPNGPNLNAEFKVNEEYYRQFPAGTLVFHGSRSGHATLDNGVQPGNPFATAFIASLKSPGQSVTEFATQLRDLTQAESRGFQLVDTNVFVSGNGIQPVACEGGRRMALVLIVSDYSRGKGILSLPGASLDALRVSAALEAAGFEVVLSLNNPLEHSKELLSFVRDRTEQADVSLTYVTGHGMEYGGVVRLITGSYRADSGRAGLEDSSISLAEFASIGRATRLNLLFYAGCRNNPFGF